MDIATPVSIRSRDQEIFDSVNGRPVRLTLPAPANEVLPGLKWGRVESPFTPAFWAAQAWFERDLDIAVDFRWGSTLIEEIAGCLLGGHGITWEMNNAAFRRLSGSGVLMYKSVRSDQIVHLLSQPFAVDGRLVRYRFPRRKGAFLVEAIHRVREEGASVQSPLVFRDWLTSFRGIGPKTASWITRNFLGFPRVAVIDIHLYRACVLMGLFSGNEDIARKYRVLELRYLALADGLNLNPQLLDAVIWKTMRRVTRFVTGLLPSGALN
jgi:thermostable 8-oxoguanine DNA glycosylase